MNRRQRAGTTFNKILQLAVLVVIPQGHAATVYLETLEPASAKFPDLLYFDGTRLQGYFREIIDCAFAHTDHRVSYGFGPFSRIQRNLVQGKTDGYFPVNITDQRNRTGVASRPLIDDYKILYYTPDFLLDPLGKQPGTIGVMRGAQLENLLAGRLSKELQVVASYDQLVKMLATHRVRGILVSHIFIDATFRRHGIEADYAHLKMAAAPFHAYFGHQFLKRHPRFLDAFNRGVETCRRRRATAL